MTRQFVRIGVAIMVTLLALLVVWQFRVVLVYLLISLMVAATLRPLVSRLVGRGLWVRAAWILLYVLIMALFCFGLFLIGKTAIEEIQSLARTVSVQDEWQLPPWLYGTLFQYALAGQLPPPSKLFTALTGEQGELVLPAMLGFAQSLAGLLSDILVILFLSLYWIINKAHFERLWLSLLPSEQRKQARDIWRTIEPDLGAYLRSQMLHSLLAGLVLGLGYWALGSPYPILLALAAALACLIPIAGIFLALLPPLLVGLLTGLQLSLFTGLYTALVLIALGIWVKPRLFNRRWDNPILTLVILIALANTFGIVGILIAPPLSAVFHILWSLLVSHRLAAGAAAQVSDLKKRQDDLIASIQAMPEPRLPLITSSMERLTRLISRAEPILEAALPNDSDTGSPGSGK